MKEYNSEKQNLQNLEERIKILITQAASSSPEAKESISRQIISLSEQYKELTGRYYDINKSFKGGQNEYRKRI